MSEFIELFAPGMRHWREYRDAEKMLIVTSKRGDDGPQPLDLDSGRVVLVVPERPAAAPGETEATDGAGS